MNRLHLPADLWDLIVPHLPVSSLSRFSRVSRMLRDRIAHKKHWRTRLSLLGILHLFRDAHQVRRFYLYGEVKKNEPTGESSSSTSTVSTLIHIPRSRSCRWHLMRSHSKHLFQLWADTVNKRGFFVYLADNRFSFYTDSSPFMDRGGRTARSRGRRSRLVWQTGSAGVHL